MQQGEEVEGIRVKVVHDEDAREFQRHDFGEAGSVGVVRLETESLRIVELSRGESQTGIMNQRCSILSRG